jgi:phenylpropionate dioxygenase-like ring-hydroxylating dioxygenase large terminal subunit
VRLELPPTIDTGEPDRDDRPARFLRNTWYVAMWSADLAPGKLERRLILGEALVFFRQNDGSIAALRDRCAHRFAPLSMGSVIEGNRVRCGYHGLEFDRSGACVFNPHGRHNIPPAARVTAYTAVEKHSFVWIWMGERTPDIDAIPDFSILDATPEDSIAKRDWIRVQANYQLVNDNLLDLSHVSYLHDGILGNAEMVDSAMTVEQEGDAVIVGRASQATPIPGLFEMLWPHAEKNVDKWNRIRWTAPCNLLLYSGICKPGADRATGTGYYGIHMLTPETETTTHYHFTAARWNVLTQGAETNAEVLQKLSTGRRFAFADQDAPMIEAQQREFDNAHEELKPALLAIDVGPVKYKRILQRLINEESAVHS